MDKSINNLAQKICNEHFKITNSEHCKNLNYLWYLQLEGSNKGTFKPFIFLAELRLLNYLKYIDDSSLDNAANMLTSLDKENTFVVSQVIKFYRKERIKDFGECTNENLNYNQVKEDYESKILHKSLWSNYTQKNKTND